jgi:nitrogen PTS system EIIA component
MQIQSLLSPDRTLCKVTANSKKQALEILANIMAQSHSALDADDLLRRMLARERLGSTGIGHGIAIPHCRVSQCSSAIGALISLERAVEFDAIDSQPVDILFAMLVPDDAHNEHLQNLAALANTLGKPDVRQILRDATDNQALYQAAVR